MVKLKENKNLTEHHRIERLPPPKRVYIPLSQHIGKITSPIVKVDEEVSLGQKIAGADAAISSPIHASISGRITAIQNWPHPSVGICKAIVIDGDVSKGSSSTTGYLLPKEIERLTPEEIRRIVQEAGIVGMGGAGFPTHIKLMPPKPVDTFILNGAECEPYLTCDYRLMIEKVKDILKGIELIVRCLGIKQVYIAIEDNKTEAIFAFESLISSRLVIKGRAQGTAQGAPIKLVALKPYHPQGGEKQLIKNIKEVVKKKK